MIFNDVITSLGTAGPQPVGQTPGMYRNSIALLWYIGAAKVYGHCDVQGDDCSTRSNICQRYARTIPHILLTDHESFVNTALLNENNRGGILRAPGDSNVNGALRITPLVLG